MQLLGLLQPISVRYLETEDVYQIISGERRFHAATAAGLTELPCWIQTPQDQDILLHQIVENWQRAELHPYELADALSVLRDSNGYSQKELAQHTGKPESEISRLLSLLKLNPAVQQAARKDDTGALTKRHLVAIAQLPVPEQEPMTKAVQETRLTAVETERRVKEKKAVRTGQKSRGAPVGEKLRYLTSKATVTLAFRRKEVKTADILAALEEVRRQVQEARGSRRAG